MTKRSVRSAGARVSCLVAGLLSVSACGAQPDVSTTSGRAALQFAVVRCATVSTAQSGLARDVGDSNASRRLRHLRALELVVEDSGHEVEMVASRTEDASVRKSLDAIAAAMKGYATAIAEYMAAVPVATTDTDDRTVEAFAGVLANGDALNQACVRSVAQL